MTWSIAAKDTETGFFAIAIASRFFAVGALCPWTQGGVGAIATQALVNPTLGSRGLGLLGEGLSASDACSMLTNSDDNCGNRQLHVVDAAGRTAAYTGEDCIDWAGHLTDDHVSVAGNMLAGPQVVTETLEAYKANSAMPIVERLLSAMEAGEAAGGDKRGKQSAALIVQGPEPFRKLDMRVDDHTDPLAELRRLYEIAKERFIPFSVAFPCAERPFGIADRDYIETIVERDAGKPLYAPVPLPPRQ